MQKIRPHWLAINGHAEITETGIRYVGVSSQKKIKGSDEPASKKLEFASMRSNVYFQSGDITGEVFLSAPHMNVQFRLGAIGNIRTTVGINVYDRTYGLVMREGNNVTPISLAGSDNTAPIDKWLPFLIRLRGSRLEFFIEGVCVVSGQVSITRSQLEVYLNGLGSVELRNLTIQPVRPQLFVVMQFTDEYTALYREVIEPVCAEFGYEVIRGDNVYTNGLIIEDITRSIREAAVVLADITPNNANVYYEVGFAHGIGKPTILLSDRARDKVPFDISGFRLLFYDNTIGGKTAVELALRKHLEAIRA